MRHTITVAGGGSWGTALAHLLAVRGHRTRLWLRDAAVAEAINTRHENPRYLPGLALHPDLEAGTGPELLGTELLLLAIPCQQLRGWLHAMRDHLHPEPVLINAAKGLELGGRCAGVLTMAPRYENTATILEMTGVLDSVPHFHLAMDYDWDENAWSRLNSFLYYLSK